MEKTDEQVIADLDEENAYLDILRGYCEEGLDTEDIFEGTCGDCEDVDGDGCHECQGFDEMTDIHRAILEEGIIFVRQLIRDWKAGSINHSSKKEVPAGEQ